MTLCVFKNQTLTLLILVTISLFFPNQSMAQTGFIDDKGDPNGISVVSESLSDFNSSIGLNSNLRSINGIISTILPILLILAGIILLFMLISGGFTMMTSVSDPKGADVGKQRITTALTGFFLLFLSYWIIQILEIVLGVTILSVA